MQQERKKTTHQKSEEKTLPLCCNWTIKAKKTEQNEMRKKRSTSLLELDHKKQRKLSKMKWEKREPLHCNWTAKGGKNPALHLNLSAAHPTNRPIESAAEQIDGLVLSLHVDTLKLRGFWVDCWQQCLARSKRLMGTSADDVWSFMNSWCLTTNPFHCSQGVSGFRLLGGTNCLSCRNSVQYFA